MRVNRTKATLVLAVLLLLFVSISNLQSTSFSKIENGISPVPRMMKLPMKLYFIDPQLGLLVSEDRTVSIVNNKLVESVVKALQAGPKNKRLVTPVKQNVRVESVTIEEKLCYINFSKAFIEEEQWTGDGNKLLLTAIVNTLTELEQVQSVQFLVEGKPLGEVLQDLDIGAMMKRDESLIYTVRSQPIEVVVQFINSIQSERYDVAYDLIDFKSRSDMTYDEFTLKMMDFGTRYTGYEKSIVFSQKVNNRLVVFIKYTSVRKGITGEYMSFSEHWEVVEEDKQFKVLLY